MGTELEDLIGEATSRAYERAMLRYGREPTANEVALHLMECQLMLLLAELYDDDASMLDYWRRVILVLRDGKMSGEAS